MGKIEQCHRSVKGSKKKEVEKERERRRSEKKSVGDGFKQLVSQADIVSSPAWLSSASHTISPLSAISPLSISLHLLSRRSDTRCAALFSFPTRQLPAMLYISFPLILAVTH